MLIVFTQKRQCFASKVAMFYMKSGNVFVFQSDKKHKMAEWYLL